MEVSEIRQIIGDSPFRLSFMDYDDSSYELQLQSKVSQVIETFSVHSTHFSVDMNFFSNSMDIIRSPPKYLRHRCRFAILRKLDQSLVYGMWDLGSPCIQVQIFPIASKLICNAMPHLLQFLNESIILANEIRAVNFLSTTSNELIITLVYHIDLQDQPEWRQAASTLRDGLLALLCCRNLIIIGRSKGTKIVISSLGVSEEEAVVMEELTLADGRSLRYLQVEDGFSNPNPSVNASVLDWICSCVGQVKLNPSLPSPPSLNVLEMYCGNGNHTVAMAGQASSVLAVELNKSLVRAAQENLKINGILNASVIASHSATAAQRLLRTKSTPSSTSPPPSPSPSPDCSDFSLVLVDPPREGLDSLTRRLLAPRPFILYISCNPSALLRDLEQLCDSHCLERFAVIDHFPYTPHLECAVLLRRKDLPPSPPPPTLPSDPRREESPAIS